MKKYLLFIFILCLNLFSQEQEGYFYSNRGIRDGISDGITKSFGSEIPVLPAQDNLILAWEFQRDRGVGINTYSASIQSLVGSDLLYFFNGATDSTAFGYIYFDTVVAQYSTYSYTHTPPFTFLIKATILNVKSIYEYGYLFIDETTSFFAIPIREIRYDYVTEGFTGGTWFAINTTGYGNDSCIVWDSDGDVYRNGFIRKDQSLSLSGSITGWFDIGGYGSGMMNMRLYCFYVWDIELSSSQIDTLTMLFNQ